MISQHNDLLERNALNGTAKSTLLTPANDNDVELFIHALSIYQNKGVVSGQTFGVEVGDEGDEDWGYAVWRPRFDSGTLHVMHYYASSAESMRAIIANASAFAATNTVGIEQLSIWAHDDQSFDLLDKIGFSPKAGEGGKQKQMLRLLDDTCMPKQLVAQTVWYYPAASMNVRL